MTSLHRRRRILAGPQLLEDRSVPAVIPATVDPDIDPAGAISELIDIINDANSNGDSTDVINLLPGKTYEFNTAYDLFDGGTALPVIQYIDSTDLSGTPQDITINGNGSTFVRPAGAESFRFLRAIGYVNPDVPIVIPDSATGPTLRLNDLTLSGANVFDYTYANRIDRAFPVLDGGAVRLDNADLIANGVTFFHNTSADNGGAVGFNGRYGFEGRSTFTNTTFSDNFAGLLGGGLSVLQPDRSPTIYSEFSFTDATLDANVSLTGGGALHGDLIQFDLLRTKVTNNLGEVGGVSGAIVHSDFSIFQKNAAIGQGPAAVIATGNMLRLYNTTITGNTSQGGGAAVGQGSGRAVELFNSTVHANFGGAAAITAPVGEVVVTFSTITDNIASAGSVAGVSVPANFLTVYGSVIAGNRVPAFNSPTADVQTVRVRNDGFNLIGVAPAAFPAGKTDLVGFPGVPLDPMLSDLTDIGGLMDITLVRLPADGSPLLDAGGVPTADRLSEDQRGLPRVVGIAADIGAAERQAGDPSLPALPLPGAVPPPPPPTTQIFTATIDPAVDNVGAVNQIIGFFAAANNNAAQADIINLWAGGTYIFNNSFDNYDGGTALPVIDTIDNTVTINGNDATFLRPAGAPSFRFLRAVGYVTPNAPPIPPDVADGPTLVINDLTFSGGNTFDYSYPNRTDLAFPSLDGGAVRLDNANIITNNVTFFHNTSADNGGGLALKAKYSFPGVSTFNNTIFRDNFAGLAGGGVSMLQPDTSPSILTLWSFNDSEFDDNVSLTGAGAAHGDPAEFHLLRTKVTDNLGDVGGVSASTVYADFTLFRGNSSRGEGAAAVTATGNMLRLNNTTITNNASQSGSAAVGQGSGRAVELFNSTVHGNFGGSAAITAPIGEVVVTFSTITNNRATAGDVAGVSVPANYLTVYGSVIAGNRVTDPLSPNVDVSTVRVRNDGFNLIGVAPASFPAGPTDKTGLPGAELNPLLSDIGNFGGPAGITLVRLPTAGSPLLNAAGTPLASRITTDERGSAFVRVFGAAADIGAAEFQTGDPTTLAPLAPLPPLIPPPPPPPPPPPGPAPQPAVAVAPGAPISAGTPGPTVITVMGTQVQTSRIPPNEIRFQNTDGTVKLRVTPFASSIPGGIRVASADVNGDNNPDLIAATGPGAASLVNVFDGKTGSKIASFSPFGDFAGGLFVTVGDLSGDGRADIVVTADNGGGPRVTVYRTTDYQPFINFFGISDTAFRGGARAAVGDIDNDGTNDLVVTAGPGGGPRVAIFDGTSLSGAEYTGKLVNDFFVYDQSLRDGVYVAVGDVNLDGFDDLFVAAAGGGGPRVSVFNSQILSQTSGLTTIANFFSGDLSRRDGVPIAVQDLDGDGRADLIAGGGSTGTVRVYYGATITTGNPTSEFDAFAGYLGGVFVG